MNCPPVGCVACMPDAGCTPQAVTTTSAKHASGALTFSAGNLVDGNPDTQWCSMRLPVTNMQLTFKFDAPVDVSSVCIRWVAGSSPSKLRIERGVRRVVAGRDRHGEFAETRAEAGDLLFEPLQQVDVVLETDLVDTGAAIQRVSLRNTRVWALRLFPMSDSPATTCLAATEVAIYTPDPSRLHVPVLSVVNAVQSWVQRAAVHVPAARDQSVATLLRMALASGSLANLLRVIGALVEMPDTATTLGPLAAATSSEAAAVLRDQTRTAEEKLGEYLISGGIVGGAVDARFDPQAGSPTGLRYAHGLRRVTSKSSHNAMAVLNMGFSEGRWRWVFRLDVDLPGAECVNFGATLKPITAFTYTAPHVFMYRAYNGALNGRGVQGSNRKVCHPGETVQFELDCEQGTLSLWVNNEPQVRRVIVPRCCRA